MLEPDTAIAEHKAFLKVLEDEGIKVIQLDDLVSDTWKKASQNAKDEFIQTWLDEAEPIDSAYKRKS